MAKTVAAVSAPVSVPLVGQANSSYTWDASVSQRLERASSVWANCVVPELCVITSYARALQILHQSCHWASSGASFKGDHDLFQQLYEGAAATVDEVGERSTSANGDSATNPYCQLQTVAHIFKNCAVDVAATSPSMLVSSALKVELEFLEIIESVCEKLEASKSSTRGLSSLLESVAQRHEVHVYLLQRRSKNSLVLPRRDQLQ